jgi:hypothetical protein
MVSIEFDQARSAAPTVRPLLVAVEAAAFRALGFVRTAIHAAFVAWAFLLNPLLFVVTAVLLGAVALGVSALHR